MLLHFQCKFNATVNLVLHFRVPSKARLHFRRRFTARLVPVLHLQNIFWFLISNALLPPVFNEEPEFCKSANTKSEIRLVLMIYSS
jgi:hypothetical protein